MSITPADMVHVALPEGEIGAAVSFAYHALTHRDQAAQSAEDALQFFTRTLLEELAERMVLQWLAENNKYATSAADKGAMQPDLCHVIWVRDVRERRVRAGIKTLLARSDPEGMIASQKLHLAPEEIRGINIAVCYRLPAGNDPGTTLPSLARAAIAGWVSDKNLRQARKAGAPASLLLQEMRPMAELLQFLIR